jgi:hypothetical protein
VCEKSVNGLSEAVRLLQANTGRELSAGDLDWAREGAAGAVPVFRPASAQQSGFWVRRVWPLAAKSGAQQEQAWGMEERGDLVFVGDQGERLGAWRRGPTRSRVSDARASVWQTRSPRPCLLRLWCKRGRRSRCRTGATRSPASLFLFLQALLRQRRRPSNSNNNNNNNNSNNINHALQMPPYKPLPCSLQLPTQDLLQLSCKASWGARMWMPANGRVAKRKVNTSRLPPRPRRRRRRRHRCMQ